MPTNTEAAAMLLQQAAYFFESLAEENEHLREEMQHNADTFVRVATLLIADPNGEFIDD